jgi:uncharacterized protein YcnI
MNRSFGRGLAAVLGGCGLAVFAGAGLVSAHVEPDPAAVEAGTVATVGFSPEHGCAGSPTNGIDIQIPTGITDAQPVAKDGWEAVLDGDVIRFTGGPSPDPEGPDTFSITFTAPTTAGVINFPTVQTCVEGSTDWLDIAVEGGAEPEHPAPSVLITEGPPTPEDLAGHDEGATDETHDEATATSDAGDHHDEEATASDDSSGDDSNTGVIIVVVVIAAAVVGGGGYLAARSRRNRSST